MLNRRTMSAIRDEQLKQLATIKQFRLCLATYTQSRYRTDSALATERQAFGEACSKLDELRAIMGERKWPAWAARNLSAQQRVWGIKTSGMGESAYLVKRRVLGANRGQRA